MIGAVFCRWYDFRKILMLLECRFGEIMRCGGDAMGIAMGDLTCSDSITGWMR